MTEMDYKNKGRRVKLIHTDDQYTELKAGDTGTYQYAIINIDMTQHAISWDSGSQLMLIEGVDSFEFLELTPRDVIKADTPEAKEVLDGIDNLLKTLGLAT
jgi:hypothetical protein